MPVFDYRCHDCRRRSTKLFKTFAAVHDPPCPHCGSDRLERLLSRVAIVRGSASDDSLGDDDFSGMDAAMEGLESGDPRSLARMTRQMSEEMGEDLPDEFEPMLRRMESGEMPDDAEFEDAASDLDDGGDAFDEN
ncbi:MAG: zinc ribbon domain-containing protein [Chloroflexi bacterium]|nr:zinc ribbon domain-containing protein [Chloroflexota bacterium]